MVTLLTVGNSEGERRCDARCYNAEGPECDCCCGGANHGVGLRKAMQQTADHAEKLVELYQKQTGEKVDWVVVGDPAQGDLFTPKG